MNSRERILKAVNYQKPDRIPVDLGAMRASGINAVVYDGLKKRLGIHTPTKVYDTMQILAEVELDVVDRLGIDVLPLETATARWAAMAPDEGQLRKLFCGLDVYFEPDANFGQAEDGSWLLRNAEGDAYARMPNGGFYFDHVRPTMASTQIDPAAFKPIAQVKDEELAEMATRGEFLYNNTDKAILGWGAGISLIGLSFLLSENITQGSLDEWYCALMTEKEMAHEMMGRYVDAAIQRLKQCHQAIGDYCFAWGIASDDAGTQKSEVLAPDLFREMIKPHYKRLCDWVHTNTNWKTFLHSCGSIYNYIEDWIDAGIDILNPVQISAANMEPQRLMDRYAGKVVFWGGGCDTQRVLPTATPDEVKRHVRENMAIFGSGQGGYVFCQVHNIQQDVPPENVEAMYATLRQHAK